jgi:uncharacterized C2H2 Zn-finger protein
MIMKAEKEHFKAFREEDVGDEQVQDANLGLDDSNQTVNVDILKKNMSAMPVPMPKAEIKQEQIDEIDELQLKCDLCEYSTYARKNWLRHVKSHSNPNYVYRSMNTSDSTRPFKCEFPGCSKYYQAKKYLNRHQKSHLSESRESV